MILDQLKLPCIDDERMFNYFDPHQVRKIRELHIKHAIEQHAIQYNSTHNLTGTLTAQAELISDNQGTVKLHWRGDNAYDNIYVYGQHIASRRNHWHQDTEYPDNAFLECNVSLDFYGESVPSLWTNEQKSEYSKLLLALNEAPSWTMWVKAINNATGMLKTWTNQHNEALAIKPNWKNVAGWNMFWILEKDLELMHHNQIDTKSTATAITGSMLHYLQLHGFMHHSGETSFALTKNIALHPEWNMTIPIENRLMPLLETYLAREFNVHIGVVNVFAGLEKVCRLMHDVQDKRFFTFQEIDAYANVPNIQPLELTLLE